MADIEVAVIGAGVVGLAVAARLSARHPNLLVLEKHSKYGMETSSRNSEVIHAGIYYPPESLRARLCIEGRDELYTICRAHDIPHRQITKLITATEESERPKLEAIYRNAVSNNVPLELLDRTATHRLEPNIRSVASLFSPLTGVISAHRLMDFFYHQTLRNGGAVQHRCKVVGIETVSDGYRLTVEEETGHTLITADTVVNCAGLWADEIAAMAGIDIDEAGYRLHWAKGSYFSVVPSKANVVSRLIYPVPQNEGLGVHALIDWGGRLKFGPDVEYLADRIADYRVDASKRPSFAVAVQRLIPSITEEDLEPEMSGIRAKLQRKGEPPRDFVITHERERGLHGFVNAIGIDSPGLTAAPAIARYVEQLLFGCNSSA